MFIHAIDNHMLLKGVFCTHCHPCNLQGILEFNHINITHLVPQSQSCLGFTKWMGPFPCDGCGGVSLPHNDGASVDSGTRVMVGTVVFSAFCSDPMGGISILGPISLGSASGNAIIPPYGTSGVPVLHHCHFLEVLLSSC